MHLFVGGGRGEVVERPDVAAHDRAYAAVAMLSNERVRLDPITPRLARAMLQGTPDPDLPWEEGFPLPSVRGALERIVTAEGTGHDLQPFFAYVIVRRADGSPSGTPASTVRPPWRARWRSGTRSSRRPAARASPPTRPACSSSWARRSRASAVTARVEPTNTPSRRLLERLGIRPGRRARRPRPVRAGSRELRRCEPAAALGPAVRRDAAGIVDLRAHAAPRRPRRLPRERPEDDLAALLSGLPVVMLTSTGAKSGRESTGPLLGFEEGDVVILIASNYGQAHHPAWLLQPARPSVARSWGAGSGASWWPRRSRARAGALPGHRRRGLSGYRRYEQRAAPRRISVFRLS